MINQMNKYKCTQLDGICRRRGQKEERNKEEYKKRGMKNEGVNKNK